MQLSYGEFKRRLLPNIGDDAHCVKNFQDECDFVRKHMGIDDNEVITFGVDAGCYDQDVESIEVDTRRRFLLTDCETQFIRDEDYIDEQHRREFLRRQEAIFLTGGEKKP